MKMKMDSALLLLLAFLSLCQAMAPNNTSSSSSDVSCPSRVSRVYRRRSCPRPCTASKDCSAKRFCLCDGVCGLSCVNPSRLCPWPLPLNSSVAVLLSPSPSFSSLVEVRCKDGYQMSSGLQVVIRRCQSDRKWSDEEVDCIQANATTNVTSDFTDTFNIQENIYEGTAVQCVCPGGYLSDGRENSTLKTTATSTQTPNVTSSCPLTSGCPLTSDLTTTLSTQEDTNGGTTTQHRTPGGNRSDEGENTTPNITMTTSTTTTSVTLSCPLTSNLTVELSIMGNATVGGTIQYDCPGGELLVGRTENLCQHNQTWRFPHPTCVALECPAPPDVENGHVVAVKRASYKPRYDIHYLCKKTFMMDGPQKITCLPNGTWTKDPPKCRARCKIPAFRSKVMVDGVMKNPEEFPDSSVPHNKSVTFFCEDPDHRCKFNKTTTCFDGNLKPPSCYQEPTWFRYNVFTKYVVSNLKSCWELGLKSTEAPPTHSNLITTTLQ